ncbi:MAG: nucleotide exchange factor GrpE [Lachnospiraceae bacterium]|nr:nucleotide exchange factor GrpE [Lachnospiraceae bacterium]
MADEESVDLFRDQAPEESPADETATNERDTGDAADVNAEGFTDAEEAGEIPEKSEIEEAAEEQEAETEPAQEEETMKGGKSRKEAKKDKRDERIAELEDRVLRQQAEFVNFRNRTDKEKAQMFEVGAKSAFEKILPVIDNFERGLATLSEEEKAQPFAAGMEKTYKQLMTALTEAGVTPIEAVGQAFDPELHNAVMHVEDESAGENIVVEEFQKGYKYRDSVLRHSMVKVAN